MDTINVSLPSQLKSQADSLVKRGYFASFSDLVRTALRKQVKENEYDLMAEEAIEEYEQGKTVVLNTPEEIEDYVRKVTGT